MFSFLTVSHLRKQRFLSPSGGGDLPCYLRTCACHRVAQWNWEWQGDGWEHRNSFVRMLRIGWLFKFASSVAVTQFKPYIKTFPWGADISCAFECNETSTCSVLSLGCWWAGVCLFFLPALPPHLHSPLPPPPACLGERPWLRPHQSLRSQRLPSSPGLLPGSWWEVQLPSVRRLEQ